MLLPFEHSFVSELQQEGISRYDCEGTEVRYRPEDDLPENFRRPL